jgi:putative flippase GtrA
MRRRREMVSWYLLIAAFNAVFYVALGAGLVSLGVSPSVAGVVALVPVLIISYLGHKSKTFRSPGRHRREAPRFILLSAIDLLLAAIIPQIGLYLRTPAVAAFILLTALVPAVNFVLMRFWIFQHPGKS